MTKLLIYRKDLKILLTKKGDGWELPSFSSENPTEIKHQAKELLGFSIEISGTKYEDVIFANRVFGDQKENSKWVNLEKASGLLNVETRKLRELIDEDINNVAKKQLSLINEVFQAFKKEKLQIFLCGGWAVDFLIGKITRPHVDVDTMVWKKDKEKIKNIMENLGFSVKDKERKFQNEKNGVQFDTDFVETSGNKFVTGKTGQIKTWFKDTFDEAVEAELENVKVKIINPNSLLNILEYKLKYYRKNAKKASGPVEKTKREIELMKRYLS